MKTPPLFHALGEAFIAPHSWYNTDNFGEPEQQDNIATKITNILTHIPGKFGARFAPYAEEITRGYNLFLFHYVKSFNLRKSEVTKPVFTSMETAYKQFWNLHNREDEMVHFFDFFEFVMVKSYSEAICESIGSVMNMAVGTGRMLYPENFAKEVYLRYNLPPLHILTETFIPEIVQNELMRKRFFRAGDIAPSAQKRLKYPNTSSTVGNFREKEIENFFGFRV